MNHAQHEIVTALPAGQLVPLTPIRKAVRLLQYCARSRRSAWSGQNYDPQRFLELAHDDITSTRKDHNAGTDVLCLWIHVCLLSQPEFLFGVRRGSHGARTSDSDHLL